MDKSSSTSTLTLAGITVYILVGCLLIANISQTSDLASRIDQYEANQRSDDVLALATAIMEAYPPTSSQAAWQMVLQANNVKLAMQATIPVVAYSNPYVTVLSPEIIASAPTTRAFLNMGSYPTTLPTCLATQIVAACTSWQTICIFEMPDSVEC